MLPGGKQGCLPIDCLQILGTQAKATTTDLLVLTGIRQPQATLCSEQPAAENWFEDSI